MQFVTSSPIIKNTDIINLETATQQHMNKAETPLLSHVLKERRMLHHILCHQPALIRPNTKQRKTTRQLTESVCEDRGWGHRHSE